MISKILVPLDGSSASEAILAPVMTLAKQSGAAVILLHVVTPSDYFSMTAAQYVHDERERSTAHLNELAQRLAPQGNNVQVLVVTGDASREIVSAAEKNHVNLIALTSHGRSGIREWTFGSVAERVLHSTNTPVLVFRGPDHPCPWVRRIAVALDGSEESLEAVLAAADVAKSFHASVVLIHAGKKEPPGMVMAKKLLGGKSVPYECLLVKGEPGKAVLLAVEREKADLLAFTTSGQPQDDRINFGSIAERFLTDSKRPTLVVPTGRVA